MLRHYLDRRAASEIFSFLFKIPVEYDNRWDHWQKKGKRLKQSF